MLASIFLLSLLGLAVAVPYPFSYYRSQYQDEGEGQEQSCISPEFYERPLPEAMIEKEDLFEKESQIHVQQDLPTDTDMYQNDFDQPLHFECNSGYGINHVESEHNNG